MELTYAQRKEVWTANWYKKMGDTRTPEQREIDALREMIGELYEVIETLENRVDILGQVNSVLMSRNEYLSKKMAGSVSAPRRPGVEAEQSADVSVVGCAPAS